MKMAQPIALKMPPRDMQAEAKLQLEGAPVKHAAALLAGYELLQQLHDRGALEVMNGALAASDEILGKIVENAKTPEAIRSIRNLLAWQRVLGSIEPEWFKAIFLAIPEGIAKATSERDKPVNIFGLMRRAVSKDSLRAMSAGLDFLEAFGRHLYLAETKTANTEVRE
jgi:uncharacterized protein YjgD (DUF1641 family)